MKKNKWGHAFSITLTAAAKGLNQDTNGKLANLLQDLQQLTEKSEHTNAVKHYHHSPNVTRCKQTAQENVQQQVQQNQAAIIFNQTSKQQLQKCIKAWQHM